MWEAYTTSTEFPFTYSGMTWTADGYDSWKDCYDAVIESAASTTATSETAQFMADGGFTFLSGLEDKLECASACKVGKFYASLDLSRGRPTRDCLNASLEDLSGTMGSAAYVTIITGLILLIAMVGAFPLCKGYEKDMMNDD